MEIRTCGTTREMAREAAAAAASALREAIRTQGSARFIVATGTSQISFLEELTSDKDIDWSATTMFHLDEYVGLSADHPASFVGYLQKRLVQQVHPGRVHFLDGRADPEAERKRLSLLIGEDPVDVAFVGIGENGHLAFNDPPADFETREPYLLVTLDEACRRQQVGEGWFSSIEEVPTQALSMSIHRIMQSRRIICTVPDRRKAEAVRDCLSGRNPVTPQYPASILRRHENCTVFLDPEAASLL
ncbi:MAG: glucosamine-6-phosphate deaminase [Spirochaetaceae bacterium]|nr:MAG: glucosamine-6-phosphate deaminase [Spirochaetaceae bacterium]